MMLRLKPEAGAPRVSRARASCAEGASGGAGAPRAAAAPATCRAARRRPLQMAQVPTCVTAGGAGSRGRGTGGGRSIGRDRSGGRGEVPEARVHRRGPHSLHERRRRGLLRSRSGSGSIRRRRERARVAQQRAQQRERALRRAGRDGLVRRRLPRGGPAQSRRLARHARTCEARGAWPGSAAAAGRAESAPRHRTQDLLRPKPLLQSLQPGRRARSPAGREPRSAPSPPPAAARPPRRGCASARGAPCRANGSRNGPPAVEPRRSPPPLPVLTGHVSSLLPY
jgi:hypothetical protein